MKTKYAFIAALALGSVAFAAEGTTPARTLAATASSAAEAPQKLEKFMVTGSLAAPTEAPQKLDKFLVTGSLATSAEAPERLEKFMVTGSLATSAEAPQKLEKFLVTGSRFQPAAKGATPARLK